MKVRFKLQDPPEPATGVPTMQVELFAITKSGTIVVNAIAVNCSGAPPLFVTVTVMAVLATPASCAGNVTVFVERVAVGGV